MKEKKNITCNPVPTPIPPACAPSGSSFVLSLYFLLVWDVLAWSLLKTRFCCFKRCNSNLRSHPCISSSSCSIWTCWSLGKRNLNSGLGLVRILSTSSVFGRGPPQSRFLLLSDEFGFLARMPLKRSFVLFFRLLFWSSGVREPFP